MSVTARTIAAQVVISEFANLRRGTSMTVLIGSERRDRSTSPNALAEVARGSRPPRSAYQPSPCLLGATRPGRDSTIVSEHRTDCHVREQRQQRGRHHEEHRPLGHRISPGEVSRSNDRPGAVDA